MSTLSNLLADLSSLLFPSGCEVCGGDVSSSMHGICTMCRYTIPLTNFWKTEENPTKEHFAGIIPLVHASSFFYFSHESQWRTLIHRFKYGGEWRLAESFGRWYGRELRESGLYDDVDVVMPVPLHFIKAIKRGYNQSSYLAESIARELGKPTDRRSVRRHRNNPPQSRSSMGERWANVENLFSVVNPKALSGKHILLVDDVLTTGATLASLASAILASVPDARISIATLAVSRKIDGAK